MSALTETQLDDLIGCPNCDQLYKLRDLSDGDRAVCHRCHTVLIAPRAAAFNRVLAFSVANLILVIAAVFHPFLEINAAGIGNRVSLLDVATSFRSGALVFVSITSVAMIVLVPLIRTAILAYVIAPLVIESRVFHGARPAFRFAQELKPWAMTEIFAIGCAVALVKVAGLARIDFGPAFWMFVMLSLFVILADRALCTWSIWSAIEKAERRALLPARQ